MLRRFSCNARMTRLQESRIAKETTMNEEKIRQGHFPVAQFGVVHVSIPSQVFYDFEKMQVATKDILGRLGCPGCHSGYDIRFRQEIEFHVNLKGQVRALGE
jgi:hypothetical protein